MSEQGKAGEAGNELDTQQDNCILNTTESSEADDKDENGQVRGDSYVKILCRLFYYLPFSSHIWSIFFSILKDFNFCKLTFKLPVVITVMLKGNEIYISIYKMQLKSYQIFLKLPQREN